MRDLEKRRKPLSEKEPVQVRVFVCRNALARPLGSARLQELCLADSALVEQLPCLGKVDPRYLIKAFEDGCDAVCIIGCPIGKCRTMDGNLRAQKRVGLVRSVLQEIGLTGERLFLFLREPMDEEAARETLHEFLSAVHVVGPSGLRRAEKIETV